MAMRAKAAEGLLALPSSDHYEVGIVVQGRAAHNAGCDTSFKTHFQIGTSIPLQHKSARESMPKGSA